MKKLLIPTFSLLLAAATTQAQTAYTSLKSDIKRDKQEEAATKKDKREERKELRKLEGREVTYQSKEHFAADFANVQEVSWERTDDFDEAVFTQDGQRMRAFYDNKSELVGTTTVKQFSDLPLAAQQYIAKKYAGYETKEVFLFDDNEQNETDMLLFGNQFDDADNYFVGMEKDGRKIVLKVGMDGLVSFFPVKQ
jgi:hypothetical protein